MNEIEAKQLLPLIVNLAAAITHLSTATALMAADRKAEAVPVLKQVGEDLEKTLSAAQRFVDQASADDAV